jgi:hypothetical protein
MHGVSAGAVELHRQQVLQQQQEQLLGLLHQQKTQQDALQQPGRLQLLPLSLGHVYNAQRQQQQVLVEGPRQGSSNPSNSSTVHPQQQQQQQQQQFPVERRVRQPFVAASYGESHQQQTSKSCAAAGLDEQQYEQKQQQYHHLHHHFHYHHPQERPPPPPLLSEPMPGLIHPAAVQQQGGVAGQPWQPLLEGPQLHSEHCNRHEKQHHPQQQQQHQEHDHPQQQHHYQQQQHHHKKKHQQQPPIGVVQSAGAGGIYPGFSGHKLRDGEKKQAKSIAYELVRATMTRGLNAGTLSKEQRNAATPTAGRAVYLLVRGGSLPLLWLLEWKREKDSGRMVDGALDMIGVEQGGTGLREVVLDKLADAGFTASMLGLD